jgi:STE24 endopeptidase
MMISQIHLLMLFSAFPPFLHSIPLLQSFGFPPSVYISSQGKTHIPVVLAFFLFQMAISPFDTLVKFAMNGVTRRFEYQADKFAAELREVEGSNIDKSITVAGDGQGDFNDKGGTMGERLGRALIGLHVENLSTVWVDWL